MARVKLRGTAAGVSGQKRVVKKRARHVPPERLDAQHDMIQRKLAEVRRIRERVVDDETDRILSFEEFTLESLDLLFASR